MSVKGDLGTETPSDKIKYLWRRWHKKHRIFAFWPKFLIYLSSSLDSESAWSMWHWRPSLGSSFESMKIDWYHLRAPQRTWQVCSVGAPCPPAKNLNWFFWKSTWRNRTWNITHGHAIYVEQQVWSTMFWESTRWKQTHVVVDEMPPKSSMACAPPARCDSSLLVHLIKCVMGQPKQWFTLDGRSPGGNRRGDRGNPLWRHVNRLITVFFSKKITIGVT